MTYLLFYMIVIVYISYFFFNDTATTEIYTLSLHDALPISQVRRSAALEHFHRLPHFIRMTRHLPQWLVHVGDQRYHFLAHALPGLNHDLRQPGRILFLFHERPGPRLYVQHQRIDSFGKFLAHDGCRDEPDVLDRRGDIT